MEGYPQHQQLQKNVLLTIYSYRILQEVKDLFFFHNNEIDSSKDGTVIPLFVTN